MSEKSMKKLRDQDTEIINGLLRILLIHAPEIDQAGAKSWLRTHARIAGHTIEFISEYRRWKAQQLSYPKLVHHADLFEHYIQTALEEELKDDAITDTADNRPNT